MAKYKPDIAIVNSGPHLLDCMSAKRFTGNCHECERLDFCTLPEGKKGRVKRAKLKVARAKEQLKELKKEEKKARKEAKGSRTTWKSRKL